MGLPPRGIWLIVLVSVFWALATVSVIVRVWSRLIKRQALMFNDYSIFAALICTTGVTISDILAVAKGGIGNHLLDTTLDEQLLSLKVYTVIWLLQALANTFVRLSILDLLRQIFKVRAFLGAVWVAIALSVAYMVACFITFFALCHPFAYNWDTSTINNGKKCGNRNLAFLLSAIFNLLLDFGIILLPLPVLWSLQLRTEKKIALTGMFGLGIVVSIMTILRTIVVAQFNEPSAKADSTYNVFYDALWSSLEPSLGVVNACLPLFPPVMQLVVNSPFFSCIKSMLSCTPPAGKADLGGTSNHEQCWAKLKDTNSLPLTDVYITSPKGKRFTLSDLPYGIEVVHTFDVREDLARESP